MPGHLFVVHSDLTRLNCDAWLLPTDFGLSVGRAWLEPGHLAWLRPKIRALSQRDSPWGSKRTIVLRSDDPNEPLAILTHVGATTGVEPSWFIEGAEEFVRRADKDLSRAGSKRTKRLIALPVIGTGRGGAKQITGEVLSPLISQLDELACNLDLDIALVVKEERMFSAVQAARKRFLGGAHPRTFNPELEESASALAKHARAGQLVLFLGAGVGRGAGLPLWEELLDELARKAGFKPEEQDIISKQALLDRGWLISQRLVREKEKPGEIIAALLRRDRHSLAHALLASLHVRETVTLNYDRLYEQAVKATGRQLDVLPYQILPQEPGAARNWLLKLHGDIEKEDDIVLTRDDYLRFSERRSALAGIVQALLITRQMLFVGFSLTDDNFHSIVHEVRKAMAPEKATAARRLGTALVRPEEEALLKQLWDDMDFVTTGADEQPALEVFLDHTVSLATTSASYLLDDDFKALLSEDERRIARWLSSRPEAPPLPDRDSPLWEEVGTFVARLGTQR